MRKLTLITVAVLAAVLLGACSANASASLTGKTWQLNAITEKVPAFQGVVPAEDQDRYTITFNADETFDGTADCNQISGTYKTRGSDGITIRTGISTMAMCPDGSLSGLFIHGLDRAETYVAAGDVLTLTDAEGGTMSFIAAPAATATPASSGGAAAATATPKPTEKPTPKPTAKPTPKPTAKPTAAPTATAAPGATAKPTPKPTATPAPVTGLVGHAWMLTAFTENVPAFQGTVPEADQSKYTLTFAADGTFTAVADCNTMNGTFTAADSASSSGSLTMVPGAGTVAACAPDSLADLYVLGLSNASSYAIANSILTITLADDGTMTFK
jgi:heat shock protein HslJ